MSNNTCIIHNEKQEIINRKVNAYLNVAVIIEKCFREKNLHFSRVSLDNFDISSTNMFSQKYARRELNKGEMQS